MKLTLKDIFTTAIAIVVGAALYAKIRDYNWVFIGSWRTAIVSMGILGFLLTAFDEKDFVRLNVWGTVEWLLGITGVCLVVAGLVVASKVMFVVLAADVLVLWLTTIARHTFSHEIEGQRGAVLTG